MESKQIYEWLNNQKYQTEYEETGEYKMYFGVDMPKILNDFLEYVNNLKPNESKTVNRNEQLQEFCSCNFLFPTRIIEGNIAICCECEYPIKQNE